MAFDTVAEITQVIKDSEKDQGDLRRRMTLHFDYAVGKEFTTPAGYEEFTSTAPQTFFEKNY